MQLTENFTLEEMLRSAAAKKYNFKEQYKPDPVIINNLTKLCVNILQPLRNMVGQEITVSSGYRCDRVNNMVGGARNSQHLTGEAADLLATGKMTNRQLFEIIKTSGLPFDQLIWEFGDSDNPAWVHVSFSPRNRRQILRID